jgi:hypothetical protein
LHGKVGGHDKWRLIGLIVHAACRVADDMGIKVSDEPPYTVDSPMWDFLKNSEDERISLSHLGRWAAEFASQPAKFGDDEM